MAQPLYDDHPLQEYLREIGEDLHAMPGGIPELGFVLDEIAGDGDVVDDQEWMPPILLKVLVVIQRLLASFHPPHQSRFEERFKYDVISSNLLSSSLPAPHSLHPHPARIQTQIPGHLRTSREASSDGSYFGEVDISESLDTPSVVTPAFSEQSNSSSDSAVTRYLPHVLVSLASLLISYGFYPFAAFFLLPAIYAILQRTAVVSGVSARQDFMTAVLDALHQLIEAENAWDSVVNEAVNLLENDERSGSFYPPASPASPTSPLRISLHTSLHTTTTQCDNVRQLLSALTCPTSLSQLAEMYGPPSPSPIRQSSSSTTRPRSLPDRSPRYRYREEEEPDERDNKRATWNGSYSSLASAGKLRRKEKRRSDLAPLLQVAEGKFGSVSAPVSPNLPDVAEEVEGSGNHGEGDVCFGQEALGLRRKRRSRAMSTLLGGAPPPSPTPSAPSSYGNVPQSPIKRRTSVSRNSLSVSFSSGSRYTPLPASRHPLSASSIHISLQNALGAKRYACAHLLALRFGDEDEAYWEDVRSVVGLLKSTLEDAAERLGEAMEEVVQRKAREASLTPSSHSRVASLEEEGRMEVRVPSFAPMPSHLARFATHVDAISTALSDAREHLEESVASLRGSAKDTGSEPLEQGSRALQAYERLRRELGLALRECERGRERLLDVLAPSSRGIEPGDDADADLTDDMPALGPDAGSDESDKHDSLTPILDIRGSAELVSVVEPGSRDDEDLDDVTSHLLLGTSSQHLPAPGIEQIFESDSGGRASFAREKSKLSREERIRLTKERRETTGSLHIDFSSADPETNVENWGPGGDVVQELKDVIWQVGERRRKVTQGQSPSPVLDTSTSLHPTPPTSTEDGVETRTL